MHEDFSTSSCMLQNNIRVYVSGFAAHSMRDTLKHYTYVHQKFIFEAPCNQRFQGTDFYSTD